MGLRNKPYKLFILGNSYSVRNPTNTLTNYPKTSILLEREKFWRVEVTGHTAEEELSWHLNPNLAWHQNLLSITGLSCP